MTPLLPASPVSAVAVPGPNRYYINSWAARTGQRLAARVIDSMIALGCIAAVIVIGPHGRPFAQDLLIVALVTTIESFTLTRTGATLGMRVLDIRIAPIDRTVRADHGIDWLTAWRRSVPVALCYPILFPGLITVAIMPIALLTSIGMSPLRRGFHDRLSQTVVVQATAPELITEESLATWWQSDRAVVQSPWGRIPGVYDRRRARAHRFDQAWWLAGVIMIATIASVGMRDIPMLWLWTTAAWMVIVTIDETWWLSTKGATPGHAHFGYRVVDMSTGGPPSRARSLLRSVVLAPLIYIPPLQALLALWVYASTLNRGPHDLVANTIVVDRDYTPPVFLAPPPFAPYPMTAAYPFTPLASSLPPPPTPPPPPPMTSPVWPPPNIPGPF